MDTARLKAACPDEAAGAAAYTIDGKKLLYTYEATEKTLPGPERDAFQKLGELPDYKLREGVITYRLRDRGLRHAHSYDAPFSLTAFDDGLQVYSAKDGKVERTSTAAFAPVASFQDATRSRWLNPKLPFGGVDVPQVGFGFTLTAPKADAPKAARVKVWLTWDR